MCVCPSGLLGVSLGVLAQFDLQTILVGLASSGLVIVYPFMKRVTHFPQVVLGMAFNWGAWVGWSAVTSTCGLAGCSWLNPACLYASGICWTIAYDTLYAHQDKVDDRAAGIRSTALYFADRTPIVCSALAVGQLSFWTLAGLSAPGGVLWPFYVTTAAAGVRLLYLSWFTNLSSPECCSAAFKSNNAIGAILFLGIVGSKAIMWWKATDEPSTSQANSNDSTHEVQPH
eukprot:GHVT01095512.1.p2 GENE.GHVT01095512.1~~GHVT01095512.1.p2  ORF type:complete len:229 (-),score=7.56 GHVT01095512.1:413-1099(-)